MSCGHCQLKIKAELESNGYQVRNIDMDNNTVLIETTEIQKNRIINVLDKINYVVDEELSVLDIEERLLWDDKLDTDENYDLLTNLLSEKNIEITGFDEENFGILILCSKKEFQMIKSLINEM
jgi:copper chaperone CopZ